MESQKIKEERRKKFLEKMEQRNKANKKESKKNESKQQKKTNIESFNNNTNNQIPPSDVKAKTGLNSVNSNNNLLNKKPLENLLNSFINNKSDNPDKKEIDFKNIIEQTEKYDYMINFQKIFRKILIIILSLIHCLNYPPLDNKFVFKYTFILLELSSVFFNRYYYSKKADLRKKMTNSKPDINNQNQIEKIVQLLLDNFGFLSYIFVYFKAIKDIFSDIALIFIIHIIYFIFKDNY